MPVKTEAGFAMLETLIAMLIIMIGVLGVAGMQMLAINNTETARYQNAATILASSMVAKMQANTSYWGSGPALAGTITVTGTTISGVPAFSGTCLNSICTDAQMAYYDLQSWGAAMAGVANVDGQAYNAMALPSAIGLPFSSGGGANVTSSGTISCAATTPVVCTLTMYWSEKNIGLGNPKGTEVGVLATGTVQTHSYQTLVSIK